MPIIGPGIAIAAGSRALGVRNDPYGSCNFHLEIQGLIAGGFSEISGLTVETDVETIEEGGLNNIQYKLPKTTRFTDLTLRRGLSDFDLLYAWYQDVANGRIQRRNITLFLLDHRSLPVMWWDVYGAFPIRWEGPTFDATSNTVGFQSIVLTHQGWTKPLGIQALAAARGIVANLPL